MLPEDWNEALEEAGIERAELVKVGETDLVINLVSIRGQAPPSGLVD